MKYSSILEFNTKNQVLSAEDTFTAMWSGALFKNGFAYQLNTDRSNVECSILEGKSGWDKQGLDKDLEQATISVFANAIEETGENTKILLLRFRTNLNSQSIMKLSEWHPTILLSSCIRIRTRTVQRCIW